MAIVVTSFSNPQVKALTALHNRKARRESGLFLVEGERHIAQGLAAGWKIHTVAYDPKVVKARYDAKYLMEVTPEILSKISKKDNAPAAVAAFYQRTREVADITQDGVWVALEGIRDPGNLGTILRTVDASGAKGVILVGDCCDAFSTEVMRASMGSLFDVPFVNLDTDAFLTLAAQWTGCVVGTALQARSVDYREITYESPALIVMGTEQSGLTPKVMDALPHLVKLPMRDGVDSLNLAMATGIMLYAVLHPWR